MISRNVCWEPIVPLEEDLEGLMTALMTIEIIV